MRVEQELSVVSTAIYGKESTCGVFLVLLLSRNILRSGANGRMKHFKVSWSNYKSPPQNSLATCYWFTINKNIMDWWYITASTAKKLCSSKSNEFCLLLPIMKITDGFPVLFNTTKTDDYTRRVYWLTTRSKFPSISAFKENLNEEGKSHFKSFIFEFMAVYKKLFFPFQQHCRFSTRI